MSDGIDGPTAETEALYREIAESAADAIVTVDADDTVRYANPAVETVFGYEPSALVGRPFQVLLPERRRSGESAVVDRLLEAAAAAETLEFTGVRNDGTEVDLDVSVAVHESRGPERLSVFLRDVSDRMRRERALRDAYEVLSARDTTFETQVDDLLEVGRRVVGTDYATLSRVRGDEYVFEAVATPPDAELRAGDTVQLGTTNCERVVETRETLVLDDVAADAPELAPRAGNAEWGISSYLGSPVFVNGSVYGTFCFYDKEVRSTAFTDWETTFVDLLSTWVGDELEQRRYVERLAALNELNGVVRTVSDAVLSESTRSEIESRACRALAAADSYSFAWVAEADPATQAVRVRAEAGAEGYLDDVPITLDAADETGRGPTSQALRTGETQVVASVDEDPVYAPRRDHGERYGYRSVVAVPIAYEGNVFGVLTVYTDRDNAFEGGECDVIEHLGGIIGHAIVAAERRELLLGDAMVELELRIVDALGRYGIEQGPDEEVQFDAVIPTGGSEYLVSGSTTEAGLGSLERLVEHVDRFRELSTERVEDSTVEFELVVAASPLVGSFESISGEFVGAAFEGTDLRIRVRLPKGADVRRVLEAVRKAFPDTNLVSKQEVSRERKPARRESVDLEELTDKQLNSLRTAYRAGYFEWPRDASGTEVAEKLGVAPATFSQHLRAVERKVFGSLLDDAPAGGGRT